MIDIDNIQTCLQRLKDTNVSFKDRQMTFVRLDEAITQSVKSLDHEELKNLYSIIDSNSGHHDPRIRYSALTSVLNLCTVTTFQLPFHSYEHLCKFLKDSSENVKIVVMKLLLQLVNSLSEQIVIKNDSVGTYEDDDKELGEISDVPQQSDDEKLFRVVNDAFAKISTMLLDSSKLVRIEACKILGKFPNIDEAVLIKSVNKMLMSDMKRKRTALDRQREAFYEGSWNSNKLWTDDAPLEEMKEVDWNELTSCGIFIYALEDEYSSVRFEALEAMANLSEKSKSIEFCEKALGQIIEVFADEIYEVRLKAAECAARIICQVSLRHDLVDVTLNSIDDELPQMREQLYKMLSQCRMRSRIGVKTTVEKLLGNIQKFSQDKYSIWTVCKYLGRNNSSLVALYTPELLGVHPYFRRQDQDIKNKEYICKLIIVFNAVKYTPTIITFLEKPLDQHYSCLRDSYPELIPHLDIFAQNPRSQLDARPGNPKELLDQVFQRVGSLKKSTNSQRVPLLSDAINDLKKLAQLHPDLEGPGSFYSAYLQCHILMTKILMDNDWINSYLLSAAQTGAFRSSLQHILSLTFTLMNAFIGLQPRLIINIQKLRVKATALHLIAIVQNSNTSALAPFEAFVAEMQTFNKFRDSLYDYIETDVLMSSIVSALKTIPDPKPGNFGRALQPLFLNVKSDFLCLLSSLVDRQLYEDIHKLKMASARILKPTPRSDYVDVFTAGLAFEQRFVAIIKNIPDLELLRIRVQYPNQQTQVVQPKTSDFIPCEDSDEIKLRTTIFISSFEPWSEDAPIEFSLILDLRDLSQTYMTNTNVFNSFLNKSSGVRSNKSGDNLIVDLCKPIKVQFQAVRSKFT